MLWRTRHNSVTTEQQRASSHRELDGRLVLDVVGGPGDAEPEAPVEVT